MGESKRRKRLNPNYGQENSKHPVVTAWIQLNLYPLFLIPSNLVAFDDSINLRVLRVPCAIPTRDKEIVNGRARFSNDLISYQDCERLVCYLKIENAHHLYLIEKDEGVITPDSLEFFSIVRNVIELDFNWTFFFKTVCESEGYYRIDHNKEIAQWLGKDWDEATANLKKIGHTLEPIVH